jgi:Tfp pilus assembly protein PilV
LPDEAQLLEYVFSLNFRELLISLVILSVCILGIYALVLKIQEITGFETKTMKKRRIIE